MGINRWMYFVIFFCNVLEYDSFGNTKFIPRKQTPWSIICPFYINCCGWHDGGLSRNLVIKDR